MPRSGGMADGISDIPIEGPALRRQEWERQKIPGSGRSPSALSRAEIAADELTVMVEGLTPGDRLGSMDELRALCRVSVGTFNEAIRIAQSWGVIKVRRGPKGGVFAAEQSPMVRLGNSILDLDAGATSVQEAIRIRNALEPLLIEDALRHSSAGDVEEMRDHLASMADAVRGDDAIAFVRGNWQLHARIAATSPHPVLRSMYINLLNLIESHTLAVQPAAEQPLPQYIRERLLLHQQLIDAIDARDREAAAQIIARHNTSNYTDLALA